MNLHKRTAVIVGALILIAYGVLASSITQSKLVVLLFEFISGLAVIGIAILLKPYFMSHCKGATQSYLIFRFIDGILLCLAGFLFLSNNTDLLVIRDSVYTAQTYIFIIGGVIFYYLLYKSILVPRFISIWGFIAIILLLIINLMIVSIETLPATILGIGFAPIFLNEIFLAIWLMVKGFNFTANESKSK